MSLAVWRALLYKSFSIYRTKYIVTISEVLWPCVPLLFVILMISLSGNGERYPPPQTVENYHYDSYMSLNNDTRNDFFSHGDIKSAAKEDSTEAYFTEATFRKKILPPGHQNEIKIHKRSIDTQETESRFIRELCTIHYGVVMVMCFLGAWSGAGSLSHAERMSGTVERMRMCGISDLYIVFSYMLQAGFKQLVSTLLCTILLKMKIGENSLTPLIPDIDFFSIVVWMWLLNLHSTAYFLAVSSLFNSSILRSIVGTASYIYLFLWAVRQNFSTTAQIFGNMLPPFSIVITLGSACGFEQIGGVTLKSWISTTKGVNDLPLLIVVGLMMIGSTVAMLMFAYMLNVKPGPYGSAKPFYFILPKCLMEKGLPFLINLSQFSQMKNEKDENFREGLYEKPPENIEVGIKILNLYKNYGNITSVKNLSLNIYSGQITALLGHNGAGKTTTLSILSGMLSPTSGSAYYKGYDIFSNLAKFRQSLGLCPQNNLLHPYLKVIDQLKFFGMLYGLSMKKAEESANELLKLVGIYEKRYATVDQLSGGMQRKLCIALSLVGKPMVVILDEPTSGVDPESRREIWNVLLEAREKRIMVITTHFMEEADALGDQIAIMNHGEILCYGSPMFLKKHYGAGYHITVSCNPAKFDSVIQTVTNKIPETTVIGEQEQWIKFKLPFQKAVDFPFLFKTLESDREISRIGISCTTMEDVYLKAEEEAGGEITAPETSYERVEQTSGRENIMAYMNRFFGLVTKNMQRTWGRWIITILVVFVVPCVASYIAMNEFNTDFDAFKDNTTVHGHEINPTDTSKQRTDFSNMNKNNSTLMKKGYHKNEEVKQDLVDPFNIYNDCMPDMYLGLRVQIFTMWISYVIFIVSSTFSSFVHDERISSVKHLILMTGISPITYWISIIFWDMIVYLVFALISWVTFITIDSSQLFEWDNGFYVLFMIIFLSGLSMISSVYFITFLFKTVRGVVIFYYAAVFTFGFISYFVVPLKGAQPYAQILKLQPLTTTFLALSKFITMAGNKQDCKKCFHFGCKEIQTASYLQDEELRSYLSFLCWDFLLYMFLIILADYGLFRFIWHKLNSIFLGRIDNTSLSDVDSDVAREKSKVDAAHNITDGGREPIAIVDGLAKKYSRSMVAVYDVTFSVTKGECFGLLGVNGAGKSTTFNMLTGIFYPTEGNVFLKGFSLNKNKTKCLSFIGYCPQHSALIESLTACQMLTLFARLRLVPSQDVTKEVDKWITLFGLDEYRDRPCGTYSGGNKRKLNTALAFIGDPSIILLDEPTSGVDPFIRRNLWSVINGCGSTNQAIVISSHSMDECEAVCDRLTIMVRGRMECIGNTQHLKAVYGQGYVIKIMLKSHTEDELAALKHKMLSAFSSDCILKDEHQVLLHYHLGKNIYKLSQLFSIMEQIKKESSVVDDYIITDSSLEEVFLSFAKKHN